MKHKIIAWLVVVMVVAELLLVFISWLLSAMMTEGVRSLLSGEGIRWMASTASSFIFTPLLAWIILGAMAAGCLVKSNLLFALRYQSSYRHRLAFRLSLALFLVCIGVLLLLTVAPHAVLISATGSLWPSPFSTALIPALALMAFMLSLCYGWVSHSFTSVVSVLDAMTWGLAKAAPLIAVYVLAIHLYMSLRFVFTG